MPPRLNIRSAARSLTIRSRPTSACFIAGRRAYADQKGPNEDVLGHVSEEAADMGRITGETKPDLGQGTPVQEVLERDEAGKENAPEIIKDDIESPKASANANTTFANLLALGQIENIAAGGHGSDPVEMPSHKYELPDLEFARKMNLKRRYDPVVNQVTNLIMRHGKKSVAQRNMSFILNQLRTAPPPVPNPARPLLPGSPPPTHLPLDPVGYLKLAIDSVAPLLRIRNQRGAAGGGAALQIPVPLGEKQRRRTAVQWILDSVNKKKSRGSGKGQFAQRFADEIISVAEGKSSVWEKRQVVHKTGTSARANMMYRLRGRR